MDPNSVTSEQFDAASTPQDTGADASVTPEAETSSEPQGTETQVQSGPDSYEARFKGMQPRYQQAVERARQLEAEKSNLEIQVLQTRMADLEPAQQAVVWQEYTDAKQMEQERARNNEQTTMLDQLAKYTIAQQFSTKHGVKMEKLMQFNDPDAMRIYAEDFAAQRRTERRTDRQAGSADRFEGGNMPAPRPAQKYASLDDAMTGFATLKMPHSG